MEGILFRGSNDGGSDDGILASDSEEEIHNLEAQIPPPKRRRHVYEREPKEASNWWRRHLCEEKRACLSLKTNRGAKEFRNTFRVSYQVILFLVSYTDERSWHVVAAMDCCGSPSANLELLILGVLFQLGHGVSYQFLSTQTNISPEVHRKFFLKWTAAMASVKDRFIGFPDNPVDLFEQVEKPYDKLGLPCCAGSIDCVHIGWDHCPSSFLNQYKGKEGYPSVANELVSGHDRKILAVSCGHPGKRNDKTIARVDDAVQHLAPGGASWLSDKKWYTKLMDGSVKEFVGYYFISDGGYMRIPQLLFPTKHGDPNDPHMNWSRWVESIRKDVECVFGSLKKRFKWLKNWNVMSNQFEIDNVFHTCCVLHNLLLAEDGYLQNDDEDLISTHLPSETRSKEGAWLDIADPLPASHSASEGLEWWKRISALFEHLEVIRREGAKKI